MSGLLCASRPRTCSPSLTAFSLRVAHHHHLKTTFSAALCCPPFCTVEDPSYQKIPVTVVAENGFGGRETIDALVYTWPASPAAVRALDIDKPWDYKEVSAPAIAPNSGPCLVCPASSAAACSLAATSHV